MLLLLLCITFPVAGCLICYAATRGYLFKKIYSIKKDLKVDEFLVGFFHPYCNAGGGGERVLWCAIRALQNRYPNAVCVVYTGDTDTTADNILKKANDTFNIMLPREIKFVFLQKRGWVEANRYPVFTLLGQSLGSMILGFEALFKFPPDIFIDTMGYAFTLPIFKYLGDCKTACYVHYPTISTDMLEIVQDRTQAFNNRPMIAKSNILSSGKMLYYRIFAWTYGLVGRCSKVIMVNSSWTMGHIVELWKKDKVTNKVFPPCDINGFLSLPIERKIKSQYHHYILSIGQFRPEKNHALQIKSFNLFLKNLPESEKKYYNLVMVGGCRNKGDEERVSMLSALAEKLGISDQVKIKTNISFEKLKYWLSVAAIGIHTMANEHFGIGVVEFQAAGVIALAHNSGGPKMDIVKVDRGERTGFLAQDEQSYAEAMRKIFTLTSEQLAAIKSAARISCNRFSEKHFEGDFLSSVAPLFEQHAKLQ